MDFKMTDADDDGVEHNVNVPNDATVSASGSNDLLCPFSLKENPAEYVDWCEARINQLETALRQIQAIQWGYEGDCGAQRIIDSVLDA